MYVVLQKQDVYDVSSNPDGERRGSIFRTLSRNTSSKTQSSALDIERQVVAGQLHQRQGSIITKDLIDNLKKNKKRIIAKGESFKKI